MANKAKQAKQAAVPTVTAPQALPAAQYDALPGVPTVTSGRGFTMQTTAGCGTPVVIAHFKRRMYTVAVGGKVRGYVCSGNTANVVARVMATPLNALKLNTAKLQ